MSANHDDDDRRDPDGEGRDRDRLAERGPEPGAEDNEAEDEINDTSHVGYGQPPKHSRVVKGQVLNPKGRPKGSKNRIQAPSPQDLYGIILEEARRMVPVADPDGAVSISLAQAIIRSTLVVAAKGNTPAQRLAADLIRTAERETKQERERELGIAMDYKTAWTRELARRKTLRVKGPAPLPHPDHVVLDLASGFVHIKGPATPEEKVSWARWKQCRAELEAELGELEADQDDPSCPDPEGLAFEIDRTRDLLRIIGFALDGNRNAMGLVEEVFADLTRAHPNVFREPGEA